MSRNCRPPELSIERRDPRENFGLTGRRRRGPGEGEVLGGTWAPERARSVQTQDEGLRGWLRHGDRAPGNNGFGASIPELPERNRRVRADPRHATMDVQVTPDIVVEGLGMFEG